MITDQPAKTGIIRLKTFGVKLGVSQVNLLIPFTYICWTTDHYSALHCTAESPSQCTAHREVWHHFSGFFFGFPGSLGPISFQSWKTFLYCTAMHCTELYGTAQHGTALHFNAQIYSAMKCTSLFGRSQCNAEQMSLH